MIDLIGLGQFYAQSAQIDILDRSFQPKDGLAIYYPEELPAMATKSMEEFREIHNVKLVFPGCRVIQEGRRVPDDERSE